MALDVDALCVVRSFVFCFLLLICFASLCCYLLFAFYDKCLIRASACDFRQCGMCDQQGLRSACAYVQSGQGLCLSIEFFCDCWAADRSK